ncbi:MAG: UbiD family decarboxylase [Chloroflexi bacterium]|nr:UbiD family decarboxylase [Chloroflexota bacterium]
MVQSMASRPATPRTPKEVTDLRDWLETADALGQVRRLSGADWDCELGGIVDMVSHQSTNPPVLVFDNIKDYPAGYRLLANPAGTKELSAILLGLEPRLTVTELIQAWRQRAKSQVSRLPVNEVSGGPVMENVQRGADIDLYKFPAPKWHARDGGRYLGTADLVITRDPEDGSINMGTYRMMLQDRDKIGLYISPGHHGRLHRDKYFANAEPMPVVAVFGEDPILFLAASRGLPLTTNELEWAGAVKGRPIDVVQGPVTGLPIPATSEIAIEGYVYRDQVLDEGPFGEFTGYYASAVRKETYVQVDAVYHRRDPIVLGYCPGRPPGANFFTHNIIGSALVWDALEAAGIPDVCGVGHLPAAANGGLVVSIKPRYAGHARQAAMAAGSCRAGAYLGRYIIVVDEDIDPNNADDVLWALWTRSEPAESCDIIRSAWSTPLDPRISPDQRARKDFSNTRMIIDATRPFPWKDEFPSVSGPSAEYQARLRAKWGTELFR